MKAHPRRHLALTVPRWRCGRCRRSYATILKSGNDGRGYVPRCGLCCSPLLRLAPAEVNRIRNKRRRLEQLDALDLVPFRAFAEFTTGVE